MRRLVPLLLAAAAAMAAEDLPKGQVIDRVVCTRDAAQSYALYIPSGYVPSKAAPVIFCFDPAARGRVPVEQLQAAAERSGYIIAGSHQLPQRFLGG